jgi:predicted cation transporter
MGLTAFTDNAALTYLGTLVPTLTPEAKYFLVAGAVSGGGLTVIANAPNPAGNSLLKDSFGENGISPLGLFLGALPCTLFIAAFFLYF